MPSDLTTRIARAFSEMEEIPQLKRGHVWCHKCGRDQKVNSGQCLRHGWPKCCGATMSIQSPLERALIANDTQDNG